MHCPSCNTFNRDDAKFCKGCGQPLRPSQAALTAASEAVNPVQDIPSTPATDAGTTPYKPVPAEVDGLNRVPTQETWAANVQQAAPADAQPEEEEDPALAPTIIMTPERMVAYHQRRWQEAIEPQAIHDPAPSMNIYDASTVLSVPAPSPSPVEPAPAYNIIDLPTFLMPPQGENDAIPIPPPPPPPGSPAPGAEIGAAPGEGAHEAVYMENAGYPEMEVSETMQDSSEHVSLEQAEQAAPSGDFPVMAAGASLQGRYEISQVLADNQQEHVYQVIDHQGYQRCWNCNSENNAEGDDFCIDCGASLLNIPYTMHEYSAEQSKEDTPVLHGNIFNTFVDQGRTYVIEQIQAEQNAFPDGVHLLAATSSDAGNVRRSDPNEDSSLVLQIQRIHESISSPVGVYIVADGMGGHDNGQLASHMTINVIAERLVRDLLLAPLTAEKEGSPAKPFDEDALIALLHDAIEDANTALCQVNSRDKTDMGSTLTGFMIVDQHAYIVNVGDSRTYMVRGKQLYQLTTDHSLVGQLVASGLIEPDDVYTHPQRSQIYRSLGDKPNTPIDVFKQQLHPGDILLSCCDGLWEMVRNPQIESTLNNAPDPQTACRELIDLANTNGGEDNITAVVVYVQ